MTPALRHWPILFVFLFILAGSALMERLVTWSDESSYVHLGALVVQGQYDLFGADSPGHRVPLAYWLIGLTQLGGPSLWAARFVSLLIGCGVVVLVGHVASKLAGPAAGMVASALLVGHGVTVGYLVTGLYYGWSHLILLGALALWLRGTQGGDNGGVGGGRGTRRPVRAGGVGAADRVREPGDGQAARLLASGLIGSLFLLRTSLWPVLLAWLVLVWWVTRVPRGRRGPAADGASQPSSEPYPAEGDRRPGDSVARSPDDGPILRFVRAHWPAEFLTPERIETVRRGERRLERLAHVVLVLAWPTLFFVWSPVRHAKLLAYVPGFGWLAEALGYRRIVDLLPQPPAPGLGVELAGAWELVQWRYEAWFPLAGVALAVVVLRGASSSSRSWRSGLRRSGPVAILACAALLGPLVTQPLRLKTAIGYANQSIGLAMVLLAVLVVTAWRSSAGVSPIPRWAERACLVVALAYAVIWPTLAIFHPLLPEDRSARPLVQLHLAAQTLKRLIPEGEPPVFLIGVSMPLYLAGRPVSPRQAFDLDNLAPSAQHQPWADRMGLIGPAQVNAMLGAGGTARTAVVARAVVEHYRRSRSELVEQIDRELRARYVLLGRVVAYPWQVMEVWRRS